MSSEAVRYLQHENTRLKAELLAQQKENQQLKHYIDTLATLYQESHPISQIHDKDEAIAHLNTLLELIIQTIDTKDGSLLELDSETNELEFVLVHGALQQELPGHRIKSDKGVVGWAIENCQSIIVNNPRQDWRFSWEVDEEFAFLTQSILCVPIYCGNTILGVTELINKNHADFTDTDLVLMSVFANISAQVLTAAPLCPPNLPPTTATTKPLE